MRLRTPNNKMNNYQNDSPPTKRSNHSNKDGEQISFIESNGKQQLPSLRCGKRRCAHRLQASPGKGVWRVRNGGRGGCQGMWASRWDNITASCSMLLQLLRKANINLIFWKFSKRFLISSGRIGKKGHENLRKRIMLDNKMNGRAKIIQKTGY